MPTSYPIPQVQLIDFTDAEPATGMGFNSETLIFPGTALTFTPGAPDPTESGQAVQAHASIINSHEELMDQIGVSVAASGRYGFASASAKMDFSKTTGYNSASTFVLANASVINPIVRGKDFALTPAASELLTPPPDGEKNFKAAFGDCFVRGIKSGGEFFAVFRLTSVNQNTQQQLAASLTGAINGFIAAADFSASLKMAQQSASDRTELEISYYQASGSGISASITLDVDDILARLKNFPTVARDNPFPFRAEIATYTTIPIPIEPPVEVEDFLFSMSQDEKKKLIYIQYKNDTDFALQHPDFFDDLPAVADLKTDSGTYTDLINAVMRHQVQLAKGQLPTPEMFDPAKVGLVEPTPRQFKRKALPTTVSQWVPKRPMSLARESFGLAKANNGKIYAVGGQIGNQFIITNRVEAYDPNTDMWTEVAPLPYSVFYNSVAAASDGKIYCAGGSNVTGPIARVVQYDPSTNKWQDVAPMQAARRSVGFAAASNGKLYAVGGYNDQVSVYYVEEYDPAGNTWTYKAPMPSPRLFFAFAAAANGKLYAVGGRSLSDWVAAVWEYDPDLDSWSTKAPMILPRDVHALAAGDDGRLYAFGGMDQAYQQGDWLEAYDPITDKWTFISGAERADGFRERFSMTAGAGNLYFVGGSVTKPNPDIVASMEAYKVI